jgi:hypothetical protein
MIQSENLLNTFGSLVLVTLASVFTLMYLGWTFNEPDRIDPTDWKRDWVVVLAYLQLVFMGFVMLFLIPVILVFPFIIIVLIPIILLFTSSILTLKYIGWTVNTTTEIDPNDWRRKWIIFFAWYGWVSFTWGFLKLLSRRST